LVVLGKGEEVKARILDSKTVDYLGVTDLAKGGAGRIVLYTEKAIRDLQEKLEGKKK
jgi:hypothetical protein